MIDYLVILMFLTPVLLFFGTAVYLFGIGLFTAILFIVDKNAARKRKQRIPERLLLLGCLLGGAPFALITMIICHHKTSKPEFYIPVVILVFIQIILIIIL